MPVARLDSRALLRVSGPDARPFLHNILTQSVEDMRPGDLRFAALLTPQGRLLHDLFVYAEAEDALLLDAAADQRDALLHRLKLYRLRAKADLEPAAGKPYALFPEQPAHPGEGRGPEARTSPEAAPPLDPGLRREEREWASDPRLPDLGSRSYAHASSQPDATEADYDAHRLALGVPDPARDRTANTYPIEQNYDLLNGVDFRKGCFIGQETTSRMKRRGQIKTRMLPLVFDGPPPPFGAEVLAGDLRAGEVLTSMNGRATALLRLDRIAEADLTVDGRPVRAEIPAWMAAYVSF